MPACVCTAFAKQSARLVMAADVSNKNVKIKPKAKVSAKDGEYEITVDRNAAKKYEEEEDSWFNKKYKKQSLKYAAQYILFGSILWSLRLYNKKKKGK